MATYIQNLWNTLTMFFIVMCTGFVDTIRFKYFQTHSKTNEESVEGKVVLVTGAQRGIGKAASIEFAKRGAIVIMGCLDMKEGREALEEIKVLTRNENIVLIKLDLSDLSSVREFALLVRKKYSEIRILFLNAGLGSAPDGNVKTKDGFNLHVAVNHLGHFLLTNLLLPCLKNGSRVVAMSSTLQLFQKLDLNDLMMDKQDLDFAFESALPYNNTKYMNALFIKELGRKLEGTGITTYALCPGIVRTTIFEKSSKGLQNLVKLIGHCFGFSPNEACIGILYCALDKSIAKETGQMYRYKKIFKTANSRLDAKVARDLWDISADLVK